MVESEFEHENMPGIRMEVAIEMLGQMKQPLIQAMEREKSKENPSTVLIEYWRGRKDLLTQFQRNIRVGDVDAIKLIAEKSNLIF
ncbi:MAG: hypothetical protein RI918_1570 [Pseudomonadota bacterium]|jgi:hypothetical protein